MELASTGTLFLIAAIAVAVIGWLLVRSADRLGAAFRIERSIAGFILLAAATSLPELVVSCQLARSGAAEMAVGSLLGSCLMNLLILATIDLARRNRGRMLTRQTAAHALSSLSSILLAATVAVVVMVPMPATSSFHSASLLISFVYVVTVRLVYVDHCVTAASKALKTETVIAKSEIVVEQKTRPVLLYIAGTIGLLSLAPLLASSSTDVASLLGLSGTFFGAVFLALVTSLPEMATTAEASRMNADDMAIGNILGSNAFNLVILVAVDCCSAAPLFSSLSNVHSVAALGVIVTTTIATMGLLYRVEKRIWYMEPDAVGVILSALLFFYLLYVM